MQGTIRSYKQEVRDKVSERIKTIATEIAKAMECRAEVDINTLYPEVWNHQKETQHVKRLATKWFGP